MRVGSMAFMAVTAVLALAISHSPMATTHAERSAVAGTSMEVSGAIETGADAVCPAGTIEAAPGDFYALRIDRDLVERLARWSPRAAQILVALREDPAVPPLRVHGGEVLSDLLPTLASVLHVFDHADDEHGTRALMLPLPAHQRSETRMNIESLADGRTLLVIGTRIVDAIAESASVERPVAIELKGIPGASSKVGSQGSHFAQVYEVVSFGLRDAY